jgi:hypothetical protein
VSAVVKPPKWVVVSRKNTAIVLFKCIDNGQAFENLSDID